jgi:hypothetical protein
MYVAKLDGSGALQWSRTVGGGGTDVAYSILQTTDGGYIVAGTTNSFGAGSNDMYIVKLDASGNTCGNSNSPPSSSATGGTLGNPSSAVTTPVLTLTEPSSINSTGGIITTICVIGIQPISSEIPASFKLFQNYPNPFNASSKFKIQIAKMSEVKVVIYDMLGKEVTVLINEELKPGTYEVEWNASDYPSGVHYYRLTAGDFSATKKMVLLK